jgi:hypothetical protein
VVVPEVQEPEFNKNGIPLRGAFLRARALMMAGAK